MTDRAYHRTTQEALRLLGMQIGIGRRERQWTEQELAERAGISRPTLRNIEAGVPSVGVGLVFDVATLVGVPLFHASSDRLQQESVRARAHLALLPDQVHRPKREVKDDF